MGSQRVGQGGPTNTEEDIGGGGGAGRLPSTDAPLWLQRQRPSSLSSTSQKLPAGYSCPEHEVVNLLTLKVVKLTPTVTYQAGAAEEGVHLLALRGLYLKACSDSPVFWNLRSVPYTVT